MSVLAARAGAAALATLLLLAMPALGQRDDTAAARRAAALKYLAVVPTQTMLDDAVAGLAAQFPEARRDEFVTLMKKIMRADAINALTTDLLVKHFTVSEIEALTRFYSSSDGKAIMKKFGPYMGDLTPQVQAEILRALREVRAEMKI